MTLPVRGDGAPIHQQQKTSQLNPVMRPEYLLELHYRDGRIEPRPSGEFRGRSPLQIGAEVEISGTQWRIRDVVPEAGYYAKIVLDEE